MLTRVACDSCGFVCFWTDDPKGFLRAACRLPELCKATFHMQAGGPESRGIGGRKPKNLRVDGAPLKANR
jgi:hypothetical protein